MSELPDVINVPITNTFNVRYIKERTCRQIEGCCTACGMQFDTITYSERMELPNYCPNCGTKVVDE